MDETLGYAIFGLCLVAAGSCIVAVYSNFHWKRSEQRAHEEYWKFRRYMKYLDVDSDTITNIMDEIKSTDELNKINIRLRKCLRNESQLQHHTDVPTTGR